MCGRNGLQRSGVSGGGISRENAALSYPEQLVKLFARSDCILVAAHGNPDGDAIGATAALGWILRSMKRKAVLYNATGVPEHLAWMPFSSQVYTRLDALPFAPELVVALDCGDAWRLGNELAEILPRCPSVNIDHHLGNPEFGSLVNWVDPGMAATGQMIAAVADAAEVPLCGPLAECVYVSLVSDTGSFTHGNTDAAVFSLAARLLAGGLDAAAVRNRLDNQWTMAKAALWGRLLGKLRLECGGSVCVCEVSMSEITACSATKDDLEGFVEQMRRIRGVRIALLVREDYPGRCKISLRSTGDDDVRSVAAFFGGGGHKNASGATLEAKLPDAAHCVLDKLVMCAERANFVQLPS